MKQSLKKSRRLDPALRGRIEQALAANDITGAAALAETALADGQIDPILLNLAAWRREEAGDFAAAHQALRQALELAPGDVMILGAIGAVLRKEGRLDDALDVLDRVVAIEPRHAAAWLERGYVLEAQRLDADAGESYRRAIALEPNLAPAWGKLADADAKRGKAEEGRALALRALSFNPREPSAICALATIDIEAKNGPAAENRLRALLSPELRGDDRTRALTLLGDALDRQDRTSEAFATYTEAQQNFRKIYAPILTPTTESPSHRQFINRIADQVRRTSSVPPGTPASVPGEADRHVFLLGYPRSGTTLVENVLASAPDVLALEERDTLGDTDGVLVHNDGTMPDLDALDPALMTELRAGYWRRVRDMAGDASGQTFVDMNPFNGIKLPVIARLFPRARILVMRRDPRDILLSCFRVNFTPSTAAWAFSDLEEAARHYDALTSLVELCRERLPLAFHDVRYDRLVADFEGTVRGLAAFIGLEWTEAFRRFDRTAQNRGVQTASATQVRRGLYDGRGQWRRYASELAPALPILAPWVDRFGFEP
jgi:Tfp pilus assembly protein PilF